MRKSLGCFLGCLLLLLAVALTGCGTDRASVLIKDGVGTFAGMLPAASDGGIAVTLNVQKGAYRLSTKFLTKQKTASVTTGNIVYARKNVIQIGEQKYKILSYSELRMLDQNGKDIKSDLDYSLRQVWP